jgi:nucleolin
VGFADFADDENLDKAALMNGKPLMGRPIRMDWQAPKNRQD